MRILMLTFEFYPEKHGGVGHAVMNLARGLIAEGHLVHIVVLSAKKLGAVNKRYVIDGIEVTRITFPKIPKIGIVLGILEMFVIELYRKRDFNLVISHRLWDLGVCGGFIGKCLKIPSIAIAHGASDTEIAEFSHLKMFLNKIAVKLNTAIVTTNSYYQKMIGDWAHRCVFVIPNIVEVKYPDYQILIQDRSNQILCICNDIEGYKPIQKGLDVSISAMRFIDNAQLIVLGDGQERSKYEELATKLGVRHKVQFVGRVAPSEVESFMLKSKCLFYPSRYEGLAMAVLEAMSLGLPVICTQSGGLIDVAINKETAIVVEPDNPRALAEAFKELIKDDDLRKTIVKKARELVAQRASKEAVIHSFVTLARQVGAVIE